MKETSSDEIDEVDNDASFKIGEAMSDSVIPIRKKNLLRKCLHLIFHCQLGIPSLSLKNMHGLRSKSFHYQC